MTEQSTTLNGAKSRTALRQDTTQESRISDKKETLLLKELIPCKRDKADKGTGKFRSINDSGIMQVGCDVASTICARYYKGADGHGDNMVIERTYEENANTCCGEQS